MQPVESIAAAPSDPELHFDDIHAWHRTQTAIGERFEMHWTASPGRECSGVVLQEGPYYDAYIEVSEEGHTLVHWAASQFPTAGSARAWVQNYMIHE